MARLLAALEILQARTAAGGALEADVSEETAPEEECSYAAQRTTRVGPRLLAELAERTGDKGR